MAESTKGLDFQDSEMGNQICLAQISLFLCRKQYLINMCNDAVFLEGIDFSNNELRIILNRRNLEIGKHSMFFSIIEQKYV